MRVLHIAGLVSLQEREIKNQSPVICTQRTHKNPVREQLPENHRQNHQKNLIYQCMSSDFIFYHVGNHVCLSYPDWSSYGRPDQMDALYTLCGLSLGFSPNKKSCHGL